MPKDVICGRIYFCVRVEYCICEQHSLQLNTEHCYLTDSSTEE